MSLYKNHPLVSVTVITYNSSKTVIETLDSIKAQTYDNIELVICDDCSTDNTVPLCREWIQANKNSFAEVQIIESAQNTGTAGNFNRADAACHGEWVKPIAGDDVLMPTCVADYMEFVSENPDTVIVFGRCSCFGGTRRQRRTFEEDIFRMDFYGWSAQVQYAFLLKGNCVPASTVFYNVWKMNELGVHCDERIPLLEDWPRWINLTRKGIRLKGIDKVTVRYRLNGISSAHLNLPGKAYYRSLRLFDYLYRYPLSCNDDRQLILEKALEYDCMQYDRLLDVYRSKEYKLGEALLAPFKKVIHLLRCLQSR